MRVGIAGVWHETNTYSACPTTLADFEALELHRGTEVIDAHAGTGTVVGGMIAAPDFDVVPLATAGAWPAGRVTRDALDAILERLQSELARSRVDALLLDLHGAMVAEGVDDVELETLRLVRGVLGDVPLVAVHDLHGNPSPATVELCDAFVAYDTYPHVDMRDRGAEAATLLARILGGQEMRAIVGKVPLLSTPLAQATDATPMRDLAARARELEQRDGVVRVSLLPGFPFSDVERAGFSIVVTFVRAAEATAREVVQELTSEIERRAPEFVVARDRSEEAVRRALRAPRRPVVLVDVADNIGGGAPGDGTAILAELFEQDAHGAVVPIADAEVVQAAARAGAGASLRVDVGGKTDEMHGPPITVDARVVRIADGRYRGGGTWKTGQWFSMGTTAVLEAGGITIVVMERPVPPFHAEQLLSVGIEPREAEIIVVKGAVAWRAAYGDVAAEVIEVDTPGICPLDPLSLPRTTTPMRA
ncbi:MAG: M81 family metallopeptidase [Gaiellaceae bacterium]